MYRRPSLLERRLANPLIATLAGRLGRDVDGVWILEVTGRTTGTTRRTPVKPVVLDGEWHLVSLCGESDWVRNLRLAPEARLVRGPDVRAVRAEPLPPAQRVPALREYLRRASRQKTRDLLAAGASSAPDEELLRTAPDHPVFLLHPVDPSR